MRRKEIKTIQDWRAKLFIIFDDFFGTDLWMHKKGVIYEKNFYCKSTIIRLKMLFDSIKKIIEKTNYRKLIEELKKPEEEFLKKQKEEEEKWLGKQIPLAVYIPEKAKEYSTLALYIQICRVVLEILEKNEIEKTNFDFVLRVTIKLLKIMQERFRKELYDYGYIIKKEKKTNRTKNAKRRLFICYNKRRKTTKIQRLSYNDKSNKKDDKKRMKMKKVRRITTIKHWMDALHFVFYNFFYTDLLMHKQGTFYEKEAYQKKTIIRLTFLFSKLDKIIKKSKKEELVEEFKTVIFVYDEIGKQMYPETDYKEKPLRVFVPEEETEFKIFISHVALCQVILENITNNNIEKEAWDALLKSYINVLKGIHLGFRNELREYGYIIKKEKIMKKC